MELYLKRDTYPDYTFGTLEAGAALFQTMELPWVPVPGALCGQPDHSCVPVGTYDLVPHDTMTHPKTWALVNPDLHVYHQPQDIPATEVGRSDCLIHQGNFAHDSMGCILVGMVRGTLNGEPAVLNSATALLQLKAILPWGPQYRHRLVIE